MRLLFSAYGLHHKLSTSCRAQYICSYFRQTYDHRLLFCLTYNQIKILHLYRRQATFRFLVDFVSACLL